MVALVFPTGQVICGGIAIGEHEILTAAHCVKNRDVLWVTPELADVTVRGSYRGRVKQIDVDRDLAWIETSDDSPKLRYLSLKSAEGTEDVRLWVPLEKWARPKGSILGIIDGTIITDIRVEPGWSGSPLLSSGGRILGILSGCRGIEFQQGLRTVKRCTGSSFFISVSKDDK